MRQFCFDERENDKNDQRAGEQVIVGLVACVVAAVADRGFC